MGPFEKVMMSRKNQIVKSPFEKDFAERFSWWSPFDEGQKDLWSFYPFVLLKRINEPSFQYRTLSWSRGSINSTRSSNTYRSFFPHTKGQKDCLLSFYKRIKGLPLLFKAPNPPPLSNPDIREDEPDKVTQIKHSVNCHYWSSNQEK